MKLMPAWVSIINDTMTKVYVKGPGEEPNNFLLSTPIVDPLITSFRIHISV